MLITFNELRNLLIDLNFKFQLLQLHLYYYILKPVPQTFSNFENRNIQLEQIHLKLRKLLNLIDNQNQIQTGRDWKLHSALNHQIILVIWHDMLIHAHDCVQGRPQIMCDRLKVHAFKFIRDSLLLKLLYVCYICYRYQSVFLVVAFKNLALYDDFLFVSQNFVGRALHILVKVV